MAAALMVNSDTSSSSNGSGGSNVISKSKHQGRSRDNNNSSPSSSTIILNDDPSFEMLVLGCGGGPSENDLSAYWIRPAKQKWSDGFTSLDGGELCVIQLNGRTKANY